jgi:hypothetical protein
VLTCRPVLLPFLQTMLELRGQITFPCFGIDSWSLGVKKKRNVHCVRTHNVLSALMHHFIEQNNGAISMLT